MKTMNDQPPAPVAIPDLTEGLLDLKPMSSALYREYIRDTVIFPTLKRWGFEERFHRELTLTQQQQKAHDKAVRRLKNCGAIIALVGIRGLGKTTLAAQIALTKAWRNYHSSLQEPGQPVFTTNVVYRKAAKLIAKYKALFSDYGSIETEALLESLDYLCRHDDIVVIDELHDCEDQKMKTRVLTDLIDRRYAALRDTILISNQTSEDFSATIGDSILSRLNEHGAIISCTWTSFR